MNRILFADDNDITRYAFEKILSTAGYEVITACNGREALQLFENADPDLVVTDALMPEMDGFEAAEKMRLIRNKEHVPIIFVSAAYKDIQSKVKAIDLGVNDYLTKPVDSEELLSRINSMLRVKKLYDELYETKEELKEKNKDLQDFVHIVSHDLQEPLTLIQAFSRRLHGKYGEALEPLGTSYIQQVEDSAGRMQELINGLLLYSRVSTKALPFSLISLADVLRQVLADLQLRIERSRGRVEIDCGSCGFEADPLQIRQLLQNIIGNALKYHREDVDPVVKISSRAINSPDENRELCQIQIQDNGIGFEQKDAEQIFEIFHRLHGHSQYKGSGVGLAICKRIVDRHGGRITVESKPEQGTRFIVNLPVKRDNADSQWVNDN